MEHATINCIGLINSNGIEFAAKCEFYLERKEIEYFYKRNKSKVYIGYAIERYDRKNKLYSEPGEWYVKRQAFETINANGKKDLWFDNERDMIKRVSKYGKKQFDLLTNKEVQK